jgi:hypothetical protein
MHAAQQLSLSAPDLAAVEAALQNPMTLQDVETVRMDRATRLFTYAAATGIAEIDGQLSDRERETLSLLGDRLGLSARARSRAAEAMREVASGAGATGSLGYDLAQLGAKLAKGLSQIAND